VSVSLSNTGLDRNEQRAGFQMTIGSQKRGASAVEAWGAWVS